MLAPPHFSHQAFTFEGKIHQILNDDIGGLLLIHIIKDQKESIVSLLELDDFTIIKSWRATADITNLTLRSFDQEHFVGVSYSEAQNPDLTDVLVFEWDKKEPRFHLPNTKLLVASAGFLEVRHPMIENRSMQIDIKTGLENRNKIEAVKPTSKSIDFPVSYDQTNAYFHWFEKILSRQGYRPVLQCEHIEKKGCHLISFYVQQDKLLTNYLVFMNSSGEITKKFILASDLKGIGKDTFFVIKNKAIFVTHYHTLNAIHL